MYIPVSKTNFLPVCIYCVMVDSLIPRLLFNNLGRYNLLLIYQKMQNWKSFKFWQLQEKDSYLGSNPDISQKYKMGDIRKEVAITL
jgi:hypothetical protein